MSKTDPNKPNPHERRCLEEVERCRAEWKNLPMEKRGKFIEQSEKAQAKILKRFQKDHDNLAASFIQTSLLRGEGVQIDEEEISASNRETLLVFGIKNYEIHPSSIREEKIVQIIADAAKYGHVKFFVELGNYLDSRHLKPLSELEAAGGNISLELANSVVQRTTSKHGLTRDELIMRKSFTSFLIDEWANGGPLMSGSALVYAFYLHLKQNYQEWEKRDFEQLLKLNINEDYANKQIGNTDIGLSRLKKDQHSEEKSG